MKRIALIRNQYNRLIPFANKFHSILKYNAIDVIKLTTSDADFLHKLKASDFIFYIFHQTTTEKKTGKRFIYFIDKCLKVPCFPNYNEIWHYDEKIDQAALFKIKNVPSIKSNIFFDRSHALNYIREIKFPIVFKLSSGAGSGDVVMVNNAHHAKRIIDKMFTKGIMPGNIPGRKVTGRIGIFNKIHNLSSSIYRIISSKEYNYYHERQVGYVLFQDFLPKNEFDIRVNIIGNRAFAFRRFNRKGDFRASGSGIIDFNPEAIDLQCINIAFETSKKFGFRNMAYDFLYDSQRNPVIIESTYIYKDWGVYKCPGYWDNSLEWHDGNYWPQFLILQDIIDDGLLQPPNTYFYPDGKIR